jgi:hypothetical protein
MKEMKEEMESALKLLGCFVRLNYSSQSWDNPKGLIVGVTFELGGTVCYFIKFLRPTGIMMGHYAIQEFTVVS